MVKINLESYFTRAASTVSKFETSISLHWWKESVVIMRWPIRSLPERMMHKLPLDEPFTATTHSSVPMSSGWTSRHLDHVVFFSFRYGNHTNPGQGRLLSWIGLFPGVRTSIRMARDLHSLATDLRLMITSALLIHVYRSHGINFRFSVVHVVSAALMHRGVSANLRVSMYVSNTSPDRGWPLDWFG